MNFFKFTNYDVTITCAVHAGHGMSGHIFEMIEYFYYLKFYHNVNCNIFIPFKFKLSDFFKCLTEKYDFTNYEMQEYQKNTFQCDNPKIIDVNIGLFVDGNMFVKKFTGAYKCKKAVFLRCNNNETLDKADVILQDMRMYDDIPKSSHYVKKILFNKFKKIDSVKTKTALIYATTNCRKVSYDTLENISKKYSFNNYLVLSNEMIDVPEKFKVELVPIKNLFTRFDTYIYTPLEGSCLKTDCSPRFIAECKFYDKKVIYEIPYFYRGLDIRKYDIENNFKSLFLTKDDNLIKFLN